MCGASASSCGKSWPLENGPTGTWATMRYVLCFPILKAKKRNCFGLCKSNFNLYYHWVCAGEVMMKSCMFSSVVRPSSLNLLLMSTYQHSTYFGWLPVQSLCRYSQKYVKYMHCLHSVVFSSSGHEGYQWGLQASCTDGLPIRYLPAHAPVLAERPPQTTSLLRHRQHFGQTA